MLLAKFAWLCSAFSQMILSVFYAVVTELYIVLESVIDDAVWQAHSDFANFSVKAFVIIMYT